MRAHGVDKFNDEIIEEDELDGDDENDYTGL